MAVTKIPAMTDPTQLETLQAILQEHAVPKFFDRVELIDDGTAEGLRVGCYVGDRLFLEIYGYILGTSSDYGLIVHTKDGNTTQLWAGYGSGGWVESVYVCGGGLLLTANSQPQNTVAITKTASGGTAVQVYTNDRTSTRHGGPAGVHSTESYYGLWAISSEDETPAPYNVYFNNVDSVAGRCALCPIYTGQDSLQHAWQPLQRQFAEVAAPLEVEMDGKRYLVNRGIVILDA